MNMSNMQQLLAIDEDPQTLMLISAALGQDGLEVLTDGEAEAGFKTFLRVRPRIVLLDLAMGATAARSMELLELMIHADPGANVILTSDHYSAESAVEAIQKGACDYLTKPLDIERLRERVAGLRAEAETRRRTLSLDQKLLEACQFEGIVSRSPLMLDVFARIRRVAPHFRTALVTGATGTGKELVARALHRLSPAASGTFAVCNCSAIVETLFESELFGYVKGAFTGATQDKSGLFEYANGGTLFLDEIGEMPLATQAKLLRVLQSQEIQRVGSPAVRKVDVRVVAATNRDLRARVAEKEFRDDLYYRLSMVEVKLPLLAERKEDVPLLVRYLVERFATQYNKPIRGLTRRAQALLARYSWPGNVRELENALGHACMMVEGDLIDVRDFPDTLRKPAERELVEDEDLIPLDELQRRHALRVLARVGGNKKRAAEILGIARTTLYQLLAESGAEQKETEQIKP